MMEKHRKNWLNKYIKRENEVKRGIFPWEGGELRNHALTSYSLSMYLYYIAAFIMCCGV